MQPSEMSRVLEKVASFKPLDDGEEMTWLAAQVAHRRGKIKKRALLALTLPDAADWPKGWGTEGLLAVALILNRHDVMSRSGYTVLQAMERINPLWASQLVEIEAELRSEGHLPGRLPR